MKSAMFSFQFTEVSGRTVLLAAADELVDVDEEIASFLDSDLMTDITALGTVARHGCLH